MNPVAYPVELIVGLEPRSETPAANTIPVAGSGGKLADGWLSSNVPLLNAANTFTANQTINGALIVDAGSVSAPGIRFASTTTGISTIFESISLIANGLERWRVGGGGSLSVVNGTRVLSGPTGYSFAADDDTGVTNPAANTLAFIVGNTERARLTSAGLDVSADTFRLRTARTPASATATGNAGDVCWDANYVYVCIAANTWRRITHGTWS